MAHYNISDWYWAVSGVSGAVWSSRRAAYVPMTDATYEAWVAAGGVASPIRPPDLVAVMLTQWLPGALTAFTLSSAENPGLDGVYAIDQTSLFNITSLSAGIAAGKPLPSGAPTFSYDDASGMPHEFSAQEFLSFAVLVEAYVYNLQGAVKAAVLGMPSTIPAASGAI